MPQPSLRDRVLTPRVARAMMSPLGILAAGAGAAAAIVTGLPIAVAAGAGALAWLARVAFAVPRKPTTARIEPDALTEPWRGFVLDAMAAARQFNEAARSAPPGPLQDRLLEIGDQVGTAVEECWNVARRGGGLIDARRRIDTESATKELEELRATSNASSPSFERTAAALEAQLESASRIEDVIFDARDRLRLLNARLDESVARAAELSIRTGDTGDLTGLGRDVESVVQDMEALRQALDTVQGAEQASPGS